MMKKEEFFFPYDNVRKLQGKLIQDISECINNKKSALIHAPTGIGKTVSILGPLLKYALSNNLTIFFQEIKLLTIRNLKLFISIFEVFIYFFTKKKNQYKLVLYKNKYY